MSRVIVLALIVAILACPLNCRAAWSAAGASGGADTDFVAATKGHCRCCAPATSSEPSDAPRKSDPPAPHFPQNDGCTCLNCVCAGAIPGADEIAFDFDNDCSCPVDFMQPAEVVKEGEGTLQSGGNSDTSAYSCAGLNLRILHESFQL